jgi:hypothetical protein
MRKFIFLITIVFLLAMIALASNSPPPVKEHYVEFFILIPEQYLNQTGPQMMPVDQEEILQEAELADWNMQGELEKFSAMAQNYFLNGNAESASQDKNEEFFYLNQSPAPADYVYNGGGTVLKLPLLQAEEVVIRK